MSILLFYLIHGQLFMLIKISRVLYRHKQSFSKIKILTPKYFYIMNNHCFCNIAEHDQHWLFQKSQWYLWPLIMRRILLLITRNFYRKGNYACGTVPEENFSASITLSGQEHWRNYQPQSINFEWRNDYGRNAFEKGE